MSKEFNPEELENNFKEAKAGMFREHGPWTVGTYESCEVNCGIIELKDGRIATVLIKVTTEQD